MNWEAFIVIGAICIVLGLMLFIPGLTSARRAARLNANIPAAMEVTKSGLIFYGFTVGVLFADLAAPNLVPDTMVGKRMATRLGSGLFFVAMVGVGAVAERLLKSAGIRMVAPGKGNDTLTTRSTRTPTGGASRLGSAPVSLIR